VSKQNLNPSSWCICHSNNHPKWKNHRTLPKAVPKHPKITLYVALLLLEFNMICRTSGCTPIALLNCLKGIKNKKVMRLESKRGPKRREKKKNTFCKLESFFFSSYFFITLFSFALQK
jgi:hypothetical protein